MTLPPNTVRQMTAIPPGGGPSSTKRSSKPFAQVKELANLSAFLLYLAEEGNDRLTINQAAFFLVSAAAHLRGVPLTLTEIMERGEGVLTKSLKTTYKVLLEPTGHSYPGVGLGWLRREPDPDDERRKYMLLTDKGRRVINAALLAAGRS